MILTGGIVAKGFSLEVKRKVVDDYKSNKYTVAQIISKHGVSEAAIYKWVKEDNAGVLAEPKEIRAPREGKLSKEQVEGIVLEYTTERIGIGRLAVKYRVTPTSIAYILKREGVYAGIEGGKQRRGKLSDSDIQEILNAYITTSKPVQIIADDYGVTRAYVSQILQKHGVEYKPRDRKLNTDNPKYRIKDNVITDYKSGLFSHGDLAKIYKVNSRTISRILDSAGIEANPVMRTVSANEVAKVLKDVKSDLDAGMSVYDIAKKYSIPMYTVEKIDKGSFDNLRVTRSGETVKNYYTPVKKEPVINEPETPEENPLGQKVVELHSQGLIIKEIAEKAETSVYHVKRILEKLHLEPNSPSDKRRGAVIAFCKQGMSVDMIAEKTELSAPTVRKILHEEGLSVSKGNEEVKAKVLELHQQGLKAPKIALECGISAPTVRKIISEAQVTTEQESTENVTAQSVEHLENSGSCDIDVKIAELYDEGMEVEEIAQDLGLSRPMVMFSLRKAMDSMKVHRPFFTDFEITEIKSLAHQWVAPDAISNKLKCHENYVRRFLDLPDKGC